MGTWWRMDGADGRPYRQRQRSDGFQRHDRGNEREASCQINPSPFVMLTVVTHFSCPVGPPWFLSRSTRLHSARQTLTHIYIYIYISRFICPTAGPLCPLWPHEAYPLPAKPCQSLSRRIVCSLHIEKIMKVTKMQIKNEQTFL